MAKECIVKLEELLERNIYPGSKVMELEVARLTAPGENYGSIMYKIDASLKYSDGSEKQTHLVGKCVPADEMLKKAFHVEHTVKFEIQFYSRIVPLLQQFQKEHGIEDVIDFFPEFVGYRLNLEGEGEVVDGHALLLMENLRDRGFSNIDRCVGFNYDEVKLLLEDLAKFHAVPLALKLQKPQVFEDQIRKFCVSFQPPEIPSSGTLFRDILEESAECSPYIDKVIDLVARVEKNLKCLEVAVLEPFGSILHNDMWCNNTMQRYLDGKAVENKFVDFQNYQYGSPVRDLIFFLWSSCRYEVLVDHYEDLVRYYHHHFVQTLEDLNCDVDPFNYVNFVEEIKRNAQCEALHAICFMTVVVFGRKRADAEDDAPPFGVTKDEVPMEAKKRIWLLISSYGRLGWL